MRGRGRSSSGRWLSARRRSASTIAKLRRGSDNLGFLRMAQSDLAGAWPLFERALTIREKALGPEHPDTAQSLNNIGFLRMAQSDLAGARPLFERALAIHEKALGPEHPDTAQSLNNIAGLLYRQRDLFGRGRCMSARWPSARKLLVRSIPIRQGASTIFALLLYAQGNLEGTRPLLARALAIFEKTLGPEHPSTALVRNSLEGIGCQADVALAQDHRDN